MPWSTVGLLKLAILLINKLCRNKKNSLGFHNWLHCNGITIMKPDRGDLFFILCLNGTEGFHSFLSSGLLKTS